MHSVNIGTTELYFFLKCVALPCGCIRPYIWNIQSEKDERNRNIIEKLLKRAKPLGGLEDFSSPMNAMEKGGVSRFSLTSWMRRPATPEGSPR